MDLTSRFATNEGCKDELDNYIIPKEWWSRRFEYPWASQFVKDTDTVVDAACGIPHFFKYWLADKCKHVWALDSDLSLRTVPTRDNMTVDVTDIAHTPVSDGQADVVFCISVLEHVPVANRLAILDEFHRILKPNGLAIITVDIPSITVADYLKLIADSKFEFAGDVISDMPADVLVGLMPAMYKHPLHVFCSVLRKKHD